MEFTRTTSEYPDFRILVGELDRFLSIINGDDDAFFAQYNTIDHLKNVVVAYLDGQPAGCGAYKFFEGKAVEIKRMYVLPEQRGQGVARTVLYELEQWAKAEGYDQCVLETSIDLHEAIRLYEKCGYTPIPNYGQYAGVESSRCFSKNL